MKTEEVIPSWLSYIQENELRTELSLAGWFNFCIELNKRGLLIRYAPRLMTIAPNPVAQKVSLLCRRHESKMLARLDSLAAVVNVAKRHDIHFAVIKGMATSQTLYNNAFARDSGDIDILIHPDDLARVDWVLRQLGWIQPLEAYKVRRILEQGTLTLPQLQSLASPFSIRSSAFLPHVYQKLRYAVRLQNQICSSTAYQVSNSIEPGTAIFAQYKKYYMDAYSLTFLSDSTFESIWETNASAMCVMPDFGHLCITIATHLATELGLAVIGNGGVSVIYPRVVRELGNVNAAREAFAGWLGDATLKEYDVISFGWDDYWSDIDALRLAKGLPTCAYSAKDVFITYYPSLPICFLRRNFFNLYFDVDQAPRAIAATIPGSEVSDAFDLARLIEYSIDKKGTYRFIQTLCGVRAEGTYRGNEI